jgi:SAM-dependent methyltransferase
MVAILPISTRARMLREGYEVTANYEATHWWFRSRRELFLSQVSRSARAFVPRGEPLRILDYGCGTGFNLPYLAEYGNVVGCDVADMALGEFGKADQYPRLDLRHDLSAHHGQFQIVVALDVLEHCDDDVDALRRMGRFLAAGGQLILTVPAYQWLWSGEDVVSQHRRRYTKTTLLEACTAAGFTPLYSSYFNLSILPAMASVIWSHRILNPDALQHSNLRPTAPWLNAGLELLTSAEARIVGGRQLPLPAGASLVARLTRT